MLKIKCVILDDELPSLTYLRMLCEQLPYVEIVKCFDSSQQFAAEIPTLQFDICLLDINMPGLSGLELAERLRDKYIIFVSAHPEFAVDAFDLDAIDFIKKPVIKDRLEKALSKAHKLITEKPAIKPYFNWNSNLGKSIIYFDEIEYITTSDVDKRDKTAILSDERVLLLKNITMEKLVSILPSSDFIQINKGEIISRKAIFAHASSEVTLKTKNALRTNVQLALGEAFRKPFMDWVLR